MRVPDFHPTPGHDRALSPSSEPADRLGELRARVLAFGAGALDDAQCLELLCDLAEPDAPALLAAFGSTPELMGAPAADLARTAGVAAACRIKVAQELADRILTRPLRRRSVLSSWSAVVAHLRTVMVGAPRESFRVLFLDKGNRLISDEILGFGTIDHAPVYPREVVRRALELHASAIVIAHNHPSADPNPSGADVEMTRKLVDAARALGIAVHDHIIVAGDDVTSLKTLGLM